LTSFVEAEKFGRVKVVVLLSGSLVTALNWAEKVPAGVNRELLRISGTAGMKLIGNPAKLV